MICTSQSRFAAKLKSVRTTVSDGVGDSVSMVLSSMRFPRATSRDLYLPQDFILYTHFSGSTFAFEGIAFRQTVCMTFLSTIDCHSSSIERLHFACSDGGRCLRELKVLGSFMTGIPTMPLAASSSSSDADMSTLSGDTE